MPVTDNSAGKTGAAPEGARARDRLALLTADNAAVPLPAGVQAITAILLAVLLIALPWLGLGYRFLSIAITTLYTAIGLYGLGLQFGQAGIMSVGHAALMGVGAYASAILSVQLGLGLWASLPFAMALSAIVGGVIGLPTLRVGGQHYIIITFCFCALFVIVLTNGGTFTGSATGLDVGLVTPLPGINFDKLSNNYYLVLAALFLAVVATYLIGNSRYGRTLRAIRENEQLARSVGINVDLHKLGVLMVSGLFAGLAGVLQLYYLRHISPTLFGAFPSLYLALMVMLGGARYLYGPLIGALVVNFLPEVLNLDPVDSRIAYGVSLLLVILLLPGGVGAGIKNIYCAITGGFETQKQRGSNGRA
ncbi:branched-chain amino acid ABC transporter permease [Mesorhizobium sp. B2-8-9]|uniref:branched-chain amino acid ABC transporter permease n=1 Tax=Mesorhizobium sp. B2-8-9 TaxID=2589899 RepID=UPI0015E40258|nr:branched-chain amino acid ABC transporter permease [Mesorhizobium sp. B2-8-9]